MAEKIDSRKKRDADWEHIAVVQPRDNFVGGSFEYEQDSSAKGIWIVKGTLIESVGSDKTIQRYEFSPNQFTVNQAKNWLKDHEINIAKFIPAEKNPKIDNKEKLEGLVQTRVDFVDLDYMEEKFEKTDDGFLKGRAVITNVGIFNYRSFDGDGKPVIIRELREPKEVFDIESMKSLQMSPLTNSHPSELVSSENAKRFQKGFVGDSIYPDGYHLSGPIVITDEEAIKDVQDGKRALSAGYTVELDMTPGAWMGQEYDAIQRNIRYNHVAIVDRGRAGDDAVLKLDSVDAICVGSEKDKSENKNLTRKEDNMDNMKKVTIDKVEYQAEVKVIETLNKAESEVERLNDEALKNKEEASKVEAERDSLKDENEQLKKDIEEAKKEQPEKRDEAVKTRILLIETAKKAGVEVKDEMSDIDIKKAVIIKAFPKDDEKSTKELTDKLDKADEGYINARFDAAVEYLESRGEISDKNKKDAANVSDKKDKETELDGTDSSKHRQKMIQDEEKAWENKEEK